MSLAEVFVVYFAKCKTTYKVLGKQSACSKREISSILTSFHTWIPAKELQTALKFDLYLFLPSREFVIYYNLAVHKENWDLSIRRIKAAFVSDALLFLVFVKVWRVLHDPNQCCLCLRERADL